MVIMVRHGPEYEVKVFCPNCGTSDVVIERTNGYFRFFSCNQCHHNVIQSRINRGDMLRG